MKKYLTILGCILITGCDDNFVSPSQSQQLKVDEGGSSRIKVERIGEFNDSIAYNDERGIYIITDTQTGQQYVGISGIGISELHSHRSGKSNITDER